MAESDFKQVYLREEEAEEIVLYLQENYPTDDITVMNRTSFYSAALRPKNYAFYNGEMSIEEHAARQMLAYAEGHTLNNANKRMGILAAYFVLKNNGYTFKRFKRFYACMASVLEKLIKYRKYDLWFLCLTLKFLIGEEFTPPVEAFEKRLNKQKKGEKRRRPWRQRKKR